MHICFVCSEYPPAPHGGIGSFTQTLARALVRHGHQASVVGLYPDEYAGIENDQGVGVVRLSRRGIPGLRFWTNRLRLARALRKVHRANPINVLEGGELDLCAVDKSAPGVKVLRMHGGPNFFATKTLLRNCKERWSFHVADHLCGVSHYVADTTRRLLKLGDRSIDVIANPVDLQAFVPASSEEEEDGLIVFAGTIMERKGIRQLVEAMPRIVSEVPHARLEVYGGDTTDPATGVSFTRILADSVPPALSSHILWKGRAARSALPGILRRASVCTYPSHMEALPIAWLEGLASGKAVVASRTGPGPEVIDDGVTGLLCDPHNPNSIAEKIILLLQDAPLRSRLGAAARGIAMERYALDMLVERNLQYYKRIISR